MRPHAPRRRATRLGALAAVTLTLMSGTALAGPKITSQPAEQEPAPSQEKAVVTPSATTPSVRASAAADTSCYCFGFGIRTGILATFSDWIDAADGGLYGGLGSFFTYRMDDWALTSGFDIAWRESESGRHSEERFSFDIGGSLYLVGEGALQSYISSGILVGVGDVTTSAGGLMDSGIRDGTTSYTELGMYSGIGLELVFGPVALVSDLRFHLLGRTDDDGRQTGVDYTRRADDIRAAASFNLALAYSM